MSKSSNVTHVYMLTSTLSESIPRHSEKFWTWKQQWQKNKSIILREQYLPLLFTLQCLATL